MVHYKVRSIGHANPADSDSRPGTLLGLRKLITRSCTRRSLKSLHQSGTKNKQYPAISLGGITHWNGLPDAGN